MSFSSLVTLLSHWWFNGYNSNQKMPIPNQKKGTKRPKMPIPNHEISKLAENHTELNNVHYSDEYSTYQQPGYYSQPYPATSFVPRAQPPAVPVPNCSCENCPELLAKITRLENRLIELEAVQQDRTQRLKAQTELAENHQKIQGNLPYSTNCLSQCTQSPNGIIPENVIPLTPPPEFNAHCMNGRPRIQKFSEEVEVTNDEDSAQISSAESYQLRIWFPNGIIPEEAIPLMTKFFEEEPLGVPRLDPSDTANTDACPGPPTDDSWMSNITKWWHQMNWGANLTMEFDENRRTWVDRKEILQHPAPVGNTPLLKLLPSQSILEELLKDPKKVSVPDRNRIGDPPAVPILIPKYIPYRIISRPL